MAKIKIKKTRAVMSATDRHTGRDSRSREAHGGAVDKASCTQDRVGHGLGLEEVKRAQRTESPRRRRETA